MKAKWTKNIKDLQAYKCFKRFVQKQCRVAYNCYIADFLNGRSQNGSKCLWSYIKSRRKDNVRIGSLHCDGLVYTDSMDKANVLNRHFPLSSLLKISHIYQQFMNITSQPCNQLQLVLQVLQNCFQILNHLRL